MAQATNSPLKNILKINLLTHPGDQLKLHVRLFKWILSSGRYIVILVELVVMGAFVYRYKLDADLIGLEEQIKDQAEYVKSLKNDEQIIRSTQFQINSIQQIKNKNSPLSSALSTISSKTPKGITLNTITLDQLGTLSGTNQPSLVISGTTPSNTELSAFLKALQSDNKFSDVNLDNISYDSQTTFTISGRIK